MRWGRSSYDRSSHRDNRRNQDDRRRHLTDSRRNQDDSSRAPRHDEHKSYEEREKEDKARARRDLQRRTRKSMNYAKDHGFHGAPDLRKSERIKEIIGPAAPLGTCLHSANVLRAVGSPNYLPSRVKPDFLYKDDGEIWIL